MSLDGVPVCLAGGSVSDLSRGKRDEPVPHRSPCPLIGGSRSPSIHGTLAIVEILLEQARRFPERRPLLERFLARAEPRARHLHEVITRGSLHVLADLGVDTGVSEEKKAAE